MKLSRGSFHFKEIDGRDGAAGHEVVRCLALADDGQPIFWFPESDSSLETARVMADVRRQFNGKPTCVQAPDEQGAFELVFALS